MADDGGAPQCPQVCAVTGDRGFTISKRSRMRKEPVQYCNTQYAISCYPVLQTHLSSVISNDWGAWNLCSSVVVQTPEGKVVTRVSLIAGCLMTFIV